MPTGPSGAGRHHDDVADAAGIGLAAQVDQRQRVAAQLDQPGHGRAYTTQRLHADRPDDLPDLVQRCRQVTSAHDERQVPTHAPLRIGSAPPSASSASRRHNCTSSCTRRPSSIRRTVSCGTPGSVCRGGPIGGSRLPRTSDGTQRDGEQEMGVSRERVEEHGSLQWLDRPGVVALVEPGVAQEQIGGRAHRVYGQHLLGQLGGQVVRTVVERSLSRLDGRAAASAGVGSRRPTVRRARGRGGPRGAGGRVRGGPRWAGRPVAAARAPATCGVRLRRSISRRVGRTAAVGQGPVGEGLADRLRGRTRR